MVGYTKRSRRPRTDHPNYTTPYQQHHYHYHYCLLLYFIFIFLYLLSISYLFVIISAHSSTLVCLTFDAFYTSLFISWPLLPLDLFYLFTFYLSTSLSLFNTLISSPSSYSPPPPSSNLKPRTSNLKPQPNSYNSFNSFNSSIHNATQSERLQFHPGKQSQQQRSGGCHRSPKSKYVKCLTSLSPISRFSPS